MIDWALILISGSASLGLYGAMRREEQRKEWVTATMSMLLSIAAGIGCGFMIGLKFFTP